MDIKWIKLATDIFDDSKIRQIEKLPEGDSILVIWLKLLTLAGKSNQGGFIFMTNEIPYTEQMLVNEFGRPATTVQLALNTFEQFGMIEIIDNVYFVSNWTKYQSADRLEEIREKNKEKQKRYRERKKIALEDKESEESLRNTLRNTSRNTLPNVTSFGSLSISNSKSISYSFNNNTNKENFIYILNIYENKEYIDNNSILYDVIVNWLEYKQEIKDKYKSERSLKTLLNQFVDNDRKYGTEAVKTVVEESIANGYKGIIWDKLSKTKSTGNNNRPTFDDWLNV